MSILNKTIIFLKCSMFYILSILYSRDVVYNILNIWKYWKLKTAFSLLWHRNIITMLMFIWYDIDILTDDHISWLAIYCQHIVNTFKKKYKYITCLHYNIYIYIYIFCYILLIIPGIKVWGNLLKQRTILIQGKRLLTFYNNYP